MREILFRGKTYEGKWVYGGYARKKGCGSYIICDIGRNGVLKKISRVDPKTIGIYTGIDDANGQKIFEGDLVKTRQYKICVGKEIFHGYDAYGGPIIAPSSIKQTVNENYYAEVVFSHTSGFYLEGTDTSIQAINNIVVGNIHDNPELLEALRK